MVCISKIVLYTIGCPQCKVLEKKLDSKGIQYEVNESKEEMIALGIKSAPVLKIDDRLMKFSEAVKWVNEQAEG